ncbi:MAG: indolepyruvate ferredoxin oxidoreductase family protein [Pseudomonadota bacterium]
MRHEVTPEDKYAEKSGRIYLNGLQALVRIPIMQRQLDAGRKIRTAAFISGYHGAPLGRYDMTLKAAQKYLEQHDIRFVPGVNEALSAAAVEGTQQLSLGPGPQYEGIVGIWYGNGSGLPVGAMKAANAAGTSRHGGVLAFAGEDHAGDADALPHQSEHAFVHCMIPVLHPAGIEDALDLGLHGIAMSRYSGCWTGFKVTGDLADGSASVSTDPFRLQFRTPADFNMPPNGLNIRRHDPPAAQEERLVSLKLPAARAYARANGLDKYIINPEQKRLGIVTTGRGFGDTMQALEDLGITKRRAEEMGIALYKVALVWPLEDHGIRRLAEQVEEILVIEEKRGLIEEQIKRILFNMPAGKRPRVIGKTDEQGARLLSETTELSSARVADALVRRLKLLMDVRPFEERMTVLRRGLELKSKPSPVGRIPYTCAGCPHNTSTRVPDGSRALAGVGCHSMAKGMDRKTAPPAPMGCEGASWIGQSPFTSEKHIFANLGDASYFHSGVLAIRAAVAAHVNITYKILYNDAAALTGGQPVEGPISVGLIAQQVFAEGVKTIHIVSDEPWKYGSSENFPVGTQVHHRDKLDEIQHDLRKVPGISVLIYDQPCAAENRRRRKRGLMPDPARRIFINERVCDGCGDCGEKSNCLAIVPVDTEFGRKRQIDQSVCNKDYACMTVSCPAFVSVIGGGPKKPGTASASESIGDFFKAMPEPAPSDLSRPEAILVTGIGGAGVVTTGGILALAAHLEDKGCMTVNQTGFAQKGGSVTGHIRIALTPAGINAARIGVAGATVILGGDLLVTAEGDMLSKIRQGETRIVLNTCETQTGEFIRNPDLKIPAGQIIAAIGGLCGENNLFTLDAPRLATALLGDSMAANTIMLGFAWQKGLIPVSQESLLRAIELNGVDVVMNQQAFLWGRRFAFDPDRVLDLASPPESSVKPGRHRELSGTVDEVIERRMDALSAYQSIFYAKKYRILVDAVRAADERLTGKPGRLTEAVARYYYKLMAYKDEYEVARLYTDGQFLSQVRQAFDGKFKIRLNLAPPLFAKRDPITGALKKKEYGTLMMNALRILAKFKILRGTPADIFDYAAERRMERQLIKDYKRTVEGLLPGLTAANYDAVVEVASIPERIRGYGPVKTKTLREAKEKEAALLENLAPAEGEKREWRRGDGRTGFDGKQDPFDRDD